MKNIPPRYNPKDFEEAIYSKWEKENLFRAEPDPSKKPFTIVIPPPNVTGILHMGHALNNTLQDILIRWKRMSGFKSLWVPGTDHAGIATQNVVEKSIAKEGLKRQDLGREKFIERVWKWKEEYGSTIIHQLKKLGASCDWERLRFTMDPGYSEAVQEAFIMLYEKGLIYRGNYIINWCPRCQTALSDEEAPHREVEGKLYYILYPFAEGRRTRDEGRGTRDEGRRTKSEERGLVVATTRPETMLGDVAVAVNPKDSRYKKLIGRKLILPIMEREIEIIADDFVDKKFGTGAVKVTPAHDPDDFQMSRHHNLEPIKVMAPNGRMNENAGRFNGMDRFEAREAIIKELEEKKLLLKIDNHKHSVGHCYRCHTVIEPYLSLQWFVKMAPLAKPAIEAVKKGRIKFYPKRWTKVYLNWMENIKDWCISRQIWWGHRLPVYYCKECVKQANGFMVYSLGFIDKAKSVEQGIIVSKVKPEKCPTCGSSNIYQDEDVLDTWFSSWLWPFVTLGWPEGRRVTDDGRGTRDEGRLSAEALAKAEGTRDEGRLFAEALAKAEDASSSIVHRPSSIVTSSDIDYFYPTSTLVTAPEILFFWVARMIMAGMEFMKEIPFKDVYIHGTVRDLTGKKMSKSLGNIIDPIEIINEFGADALRFSIIAITSAGQDVYLSKDKFELGRNFANKIWNASRFVLMNISAPEFTVNDLQLKAYSLKLTIADKWILSRLHRAIGAVTKALENYRFNEAEKLVYDFLWHDFCDWYVELVKPEITMDDGRWTMDEGRRTMDDGRLSAEALAKVEGTRDEGRRTTGSVLIYVLENALKLLHPFMPFVTEAIWQNIKERENIMASQWPELVKGYIDKNIEAKLEIIKNIIISIRNIRAEMNIPYSKKFTAYIAPLKKNKEAVLEGSIDYIKNLAQLDELIIDKDFIKPAGSLSAIMEDFNIFIPLKGVIDLDAEKARLAKKEAALKEQLMFTERKLKDPNFIKNAPIEVVAGEEEKVDKIKEQIKRLEETIKGL